MPCWQGHTELSSVHTTQPLKKHINCACVTLIWWANAESIDPLSYHRAASCKLDCVDVRHVVMVDGDARVIEIGGRENTALTVCGALNTAPSDSVTHGFVLGVHKPQVNNLMMPLVGFDDLKAWHCKQAQNVWESNKQYNPALCPVLSARDKRRRIWQGPQHSRVVYNAKPLSHTDACCRGNWDVYFNPSRTTLPRNRPWPLNAGSDPPGRGNLYSVSERLSVAYLFELVLKGFICTFGKWYYRET